jgi:hypothetical protein
VSEKLILYQPKRESNSQTPPRRHAAPEACLVASSGPNAQGGSAEGVIRHDAEHENPLSVFRPARFI